jgi:hypothetical protein
MLEGCGRVALRCIVRGLPRVGGEGSVDQMYGGLGTEFEEDEQRGLPCTDLCGLTGIDCRLVVER